MNGCPYAPPRQTEVDTEQEYQGNNSDGVESTDASEIDYTALSRGITDSEAESEEIDIEADETGTDWVIYDNDRRKTPATVVRITKVERDTVVTEQVIEEEGESDQLTNRLRSKGEAEKVQIGYNKKEEIIGHKYNKGTSHKKIGGACANIALTDGNIQRTDQRAKGQSEEVERRLETPDPTGGLNLTTPHQDCEPSDKRNADQYNQEPVLGAVVSTDLLDQRGQRTEERKEVETRCKPPLINKGEKEGGTGEAPSTGSIKRKILTVKSVRKKLIFDDNESEVEEESGDGCWPYTVVTEQPDAVPVFQEDITGEEISENRETKEEGSRDRQQGKEPEGREENPSTDKGETTQKSRGTNGASKDNSKQERREEDSREGNTAEEGSRDCVEGDTEDQYHRKETDCETSEDREIRYKDCRNRDNNSDIASGDRGGDSNNREGKAGDNSSAEQQVSAGKEGPDRSNQRSDNDKEQETNIGGASNTKELINIENIGTDIVNKVISEVKSKSRRDSVEVSPEEQRFYWIEKERRKEKEVSDRLEALAKRGKPEFTSTPRPTLRAGATVQTGETQPITFNNQSPVSIWAKNIVETRYNIVSNFADLKREHYLEAAGGTKGELAEEDKVVGPLHRRRHQQSESSDEGSIVKFKRGNTERERSAERSRSRSTGEEEIQVNDNSSGEEDRSKEYRDGLVRAILEGASTLQGSEDYDFWEFSGGEGNHTENIMNIQPTLKLPQFAGKTGDNHVRFFDEMEATSRLCGWDRDTLKDMVKLQLKGAAATWLKTLPDANKDTYDHVKGALTDAFEDKRPGWQKHKDLLGIKQEKGQSVREFAVKLKENNLHGQSEVALQAAFVSGITQEISKELVRDNFETFDAMVLRARTLESILKGPDNKGASNSKKVIESMRMEEYHDGEDEYNITEEENDAKMEMMETVDLMMTEVREMDMNRTTGGFRQPQRPETRYTDGNRGMINYFSRGQNYGDRNYGNRNYGDRNYGERSYGNRGAQGSANRGYGYRGGQYTNYNRGFQGQKSTYTRGDYYPSQTNPGTQDRYNRPAQESNMWDRSQRNPVSPQEKEWLQRKEYARLTAMSGPDMEYMEKGKEIPAIAIEDRYCLVHNKKGHSTHACYWLKSKMERTRFLAEKDAMKREQGNKYRQNQGN